jgi:rhamnosyltransferase
VYACDYERCFGARRESAQWDHFFSMVSSGLRKDIWSQRGFLEKLQYAEDDEYTRWARASDYKVVYCPESVVMHSHNYTAAQARTRSRGDAKALAASWKGRPRDFNFFKTCLLGWASDFRHDVRFCWREARLAELGHAARIRWQQRRGKLEGFREGWRVYREPKDENTSRNQSLSPALSRGL